MKKKGFDVCFECGGPMELRGGEGRVFAFRKGIDFVLPAEFLLHTCTSCGADVMDDDMVREANTLCRQTIYARKPVLRLHHQAMELADEADAIRRSGDHATADAVLARALESEREAALATREEPSRSVLLRSAASMALELRRQPTLQESIDHIDAHWSSVMEGLAK